VTSSSRRAQAFRQQQRSARLARCWALRPIELAIGVTARRFLGSEADASRAKKGYNENRESPRDVRDDEGVQCVCVCAWCRFRQDAFATRTDMVWEEAVDTVMLVDGCSLVSSGFVWQGAASVVLLLSAWRKCMVRAISGASLSASCRRLVAGAKMRPALP